jgi:WD40 repeat protein
MSLMISRTFIIQAFIPCSATKSRQRIAADF